MDEKQIPTAVNRIIADLETCTQALETLRPIVWDGALLDNFKGTYSAHVVTSLQDILCRYALLSLCRMWDQANDAQSIPRVVEFLQREKTIGARHRWIERVVRVVDKMDRSNRLKRMRNWRDKNLGHALEATNRERHNGPMRDPIWGDIFDFESRTSVIVKVVALAATGFEFDPVELRQRYSRNAQAFWGSFVERPE